MEEEDYMEGLEDIENWDEVDESMAWRGLEDTDWSEDWDELEQLCNSDSLCYIASSED